MRFPTQGRRRTLTAATFFGYRIVVDSLPSHSSGYFVKLFFRKLLDLFLR